MNFILVLVEPEFVIGLRARLFQHFLEFDFQILGFLQKLKQLLLDFQIPGKAKNLDFTHVLPEVPEL